MFDDPLIKISIQGLKLNLVSMLSSENGRMQEEAKRAIDQFLAEGLQAAIVSEVKQATEAAVKSIVADMMRAREVQDRLTRLVTATIESKVSNAVTVR